MKKIKKYWPGTEDLRTNNSIVNPGNTKIKQYTMSSEQTQGMPISTSSVADKNVKSLSDIKLPVAGPGSKKNSFGDKAGNFLENYGGDIANLSTALLPLLLKRKKANERPYEKGAKNLNTDMKRKAPVKMYQMGNPNLTAQGTQKSVMDTASNIGNSFQAANQNLVNQGAGLFNKANDFNKDMAGKVIEGAKDLFQGQKDMYTKGMGAIGNFAQSKMQQPGGALNLISPLAGKMSKLFNKGTKMIKYQGGVDGVDSTILRKKGKGTPWDTIVDTQTGQKTLILSPDADVEEKVETPVVRKKATPAPAPAPKKSPVYDSALGEYGLGFGIPLITELFMGNPKSKIGRTAKRLIKGAIAARRLGSDIISDVKEGGLGNIKWTERGLNFMKDYALAEGGAGVARTVRGYKPKYKEQVKKAATDVENPVAPSRRRAIKESAQEAALEQSRTSKIVKGAISYIKDNSPEGKQAKINLKNATIKENAARRKFTGKAGNDQYFVKGKPVDEKTYKEITEPRNKTAKRIKELREEFFNPPQYIQDLKKQDPNYRQTAYVQEKMGQYHSKREAEGAKDFSEDVKTFTEKFKIERNRISTQPKPQGMSDEDFKVKVNSELGELNKTQEAVVKAFEARKAKRKADREAAEKLAQSKKTESSAPPAEQTTKPERASRKVNTSTTEQVNDLTEGKRETSETTQKKRGSATKGSNKKEAQSEESGPSDGPTMNVSELGVAPSNKGRRKKANGARLIKYK